MTMDLAVFRHQFYTIILISFKMCTIKKFWVLFIVHLITVFVYIKAIISFMKQYSLSKANLTQTGKR